MTYQLLVKESHPKNIIIVEEYWSAKYKIEQRLGKIIEELEKFAKQPLEIIIENVFEDLQNKVLIYKGSVTFVDNTEDIELYVIKVYQLKVR